MLYKCHSIHKTNMAEINEKSDVSHLDPSYCGNFLSSQMELSPYLICAISPTTISATGIWMT